jgi:cytochrome P450
VPSFLEQSTSLLAELYHRNSVDIDLGGASFKANARHHLYEWATHPPFYVLNNGPPQVIVGRYADVNEVFSDPIRFSSELPLGPGFEQFDRFMGGQFMTQMDGERHSRLRRLVMPAFSPKRLTQLESRIGEIIEGMLNDIERGGPQFDGMQQYAARLVVGALLTAMINLDDDQKRILLDYQEVQPQATAVGPGQPFPPECIIAYERSAALVREVIADRRANPRSDFLSDLVEAHDHSDKLSDRELFDTIFGIFAALATTPRSGGGALYMLYTHPDQLQQLIDNPALIPDAVEECLRIAGNGYFTFPRVAARGTEVGGTRIDKGMIVRPSPQAANYDPLVFPEPLKFDIHRKPKRIMTFGAGPHHCIGHVLGRTTITMAIRRLLARFPHARLADPNFQPSYGGAVGELRLKSLPMLTH